MKHYLIYQITNLTNGMIYIGKHMTNNPNDNYMGSSKWLKASIAKHGVENYKKEILYDFDNEAAMNNKERELVNETFIARSDTYNLNIGGSGSWFACNSKGMNHKNNQHKITSIKCQTDPLYRKRFCDAVSNGLKSYYANHPGANAAENNAMYGKSHNEHTKQLLSANHLGVLNSQYGKHWYTNAYTGLSKRLPDGQRFPWVLGRCLFRGETEPLKIRISENKTCKLTTRLSTAIETARKMWDEFHSGNFTSLTEYANYLNVKYQSVRERFIKFIPKFNTDRTLGVTICSNHELIGVYK